MTNNSPLVLGLDSSTSACKAIVWDVQGKAVASGTSPLELITPQASWHEQSAESWWNAAVLAIRQSVSQIDASRLKALSIAHQRETFVPLDEQGQPLCNGMLWMDERARELMPRLEEDIDLQNFHRLTGKRLSVNLTIAKIAWLREYKPDIFARTKMYVDVHAFLVQKLTGVYGSGWGSADPTGMFDMQNNCWADELLDQVGIKSSQLPELYPPGTVIGRVTAKAAEHCGLPAGLPVVAGIGDGQASGLGVNITTPGDAYLSLGTSVISGTSSDHYVFNPAFRTMTSGMPGSYLLETVILGGTYTLTWFLEKMASQPGKKPSELQKIYDQAATEILPGSQGLVVVPYWNSVLGPYWDPQASGVIVGWRGVHQLTHLYRAILEGIAFEQHLGTLGVESAMGQQVKRYIAMGGGAQSSLWRQIIADVTGKPVYRAETGEAAALGAGILAAAGARLFDNARLAATEMAHIDPKPLLPDSGRHHYYNQLFEEVYRPLFPAIRTSLDRLAALSEPGRSD